MDLEQFLLGRVAEEAAEVAKAALKAQNFGLHAKHTTDTTTNLQDLIAETNDLLGVLNALAVATGEDLSQVGNDDAIKRKIRKVLRWIEVPIRSGRVQLSSRDLSNYQALIDLGGPTDRDDDL